MSGTNATVNSIRGMSTLVRPKFEPGMLLQHEDLDGLSTYTRELNRLMFRSLFGCGVVCGLVVETDESCGKGYIGVGSGLALDCSGDPIYVPKDQRVAIDEECDPDLRGPLWVILCRTTKSCAPRTSLCGCDDDETTSVSTRERDGYEIRVVRQLPRCVCQCQLAAEVKTSKKRPVASSVAQRDSAANPCYCAERLPCHADHYDGKCGCDCDDCDSGACDCDCVLLAKLTREVGKVEWTADHRVRRFIRPVLMRDPQVAWENEQRDKLKDASFANASQKMDAQGGPAGGKKSGTGAAVTPSS
jgi:hypothetical protein